MIKNTVIRLYLYLLFVLYFFTGGLAMFVLAPLYKRAFAPHAAFRELRIFRIWIHMYRLMWRSLTDKGYNNMYPSKLSEPPKFYNDKNAVRIKDSWRGAKDHCDMCPESCCKQLKCPMLDREGKRCLSYGSIYFGYLFCGRYPENQSQIDLYQCPKWEVWQKK